MSSRRRCVIGLGAVLTVMTACSSSTTTQVVSAEPGVPRPTLALTEADRTKPASCKESWLAGSTGRVTTDRGDAVVGASVAYCVSGTESSMCLPPVKTAEGGWYSVVVKEQYRCVKTLGVWVVPPAGRFSHVHCAPPVTASASVLDLETDLRSYVLNAPTRLPPLGDKRAIRTVTFEDGLELTFAPDDMVEGDQYEALSAADITDRGRPCFLPSDLTMDALYAFGPSMNVSIFAGRPKAKFKLPNPKHLPEGTAVELFVLGGSASQLDADRTIDEGAFVALGPGHVEGDRIVPDSGSELPVLTVVGYRRK